MSGGINQSPSKFYNNALLFLHKTYAVKMGIEDGSPQGSQCFGANEVPTVCQNDATVRYGAWKRDDAEEQMVVFGQCGSGHDADGETAGNHVADSVDGAALQGVGQTLDFLLGGKLGTAW